MRIEDRSERVFGASEKAELSLEVSKTDFDSIERALAQMTTAKVDNCLQAWCNIMPPSSVEPVSGMLGPNSHIHIVCLHTNRIPNLLRYTAFGIAISEDAKSDSFE